MLASTLWTLLIFPACTAGDTGGGGKDTSGHDSDTGSVDSDTGTGDSDTGDTSTDILPDARNDVALNADACQEIAGHDDVLGAQVYYWAELRGDGAGTWTGQEAWYYFVNDPWAAEGGTDCVIQWDITTTEDTTGACGACDLGLTVTNGTLDMTLTTCPSMFYDTYSITDEKYAVERRSDGTAGWFFQSNGSQFGDGYWTEAAVNYISDGGCEVAEF